MGAGSDPGTLWTLRTTPAPSVSLYLKTQATLSAPAIRPTANGSLIQLTTPNRFEIYVQPFPGAGGKTADLDRGWGRATLGP
jgi:hypothetical protein